MNQDAAKYQNSMARCGGKMGVTLYANSLCQHKMIAPADRYGFPVRFGNAPFSAATVAQRDAIDSLGNADGRLYYPDKLGKELAQRGISSTIYAHSGRVYEDGIAQQ
jgi:hypothetical protein